MHDPNDPFGDSDDSDRTIIRPNPGRRQASRSAPPSYQDIVTAPPVDTEHLAGLNPLEKSASVLLNLLGQIRNTASHPNPTALHQQLSSEVKRFESRAQAEGVNPETIFTARYVLCTTVDEFVLGTPWGASSVWRNQSLLRVFHHETGGGNKFFLLLNKLIEDPARNIDLLELMYVCLSLGFQGRYAVETGGRDTLEMIRENLYRTIRNQRGESETALSPNWQGVNKSLESGKSRLPLWAVASIAITSLAIVFVSFSLSLGRYSDPVQLTLATLGTEEQLVPGRKTMAPPEFRVSVPETARFRLKQFLESEIDRGEVRVTEDPGGMTIVLIQGDNLFASGSEIINSTYEPILERIGEGLEQTEGKGRIIVTGHTDSDPIRTEKFQSNRALSQARADEVARVLVEHISNPQRLSAHGLADRRKLVEIERNAADKARNRRVEISVAEQSGDN